MSDLTPVPLDEIEAAAREATDGPWHQMAAAAWSGTNESPDLVADCPLYADAIHIATADPLTVSALCEALRIAVEGLDRVERWYVCKNVEDDGFTCRGFTDDSTGWCGWCSALDAIEQVNRLVDLRPVVEGDGSGHVLPPFDPNVERMDEL